MDPAPLSPPTIVDHRSDLPVLLSIPHAGRNYPDWLVALSTGGKASLQSLEDPFVDRLAWRALAAGHGAVIATAPRAAIDCNRRPSEVDPAFILGVEPQRPSARAAAGLGIVPTRTAAHGHLWRARLSREGFEARAAAAHEPFHQAIDRALTGLAITHGAAVLLDCHSMPPRRGQADLVIGNRHGTSAATWLTNDAARIARSQGYTVALNAPYAGGYVVERHGDPAVGIHALQLEFDRRQYLGADLRQPGPGFDRTARLIADLARELGEQLTNALPLAAE